LAHDDIAKARTHFEWGPTPKKGGPKKSGTKKSGTKNKKSGPGKQKNGSKSTKPRK
jgi:hypothetical protein